MGARSSIAWSLLVVAGCAASPPSLPEGSGGSSSTGSTGATGEGMTAPGDTTAAPGGSTSTTGDSKPPDTGLPPGTSTGPDPCDACIADNCAAELEACGVDPACACWFDCYQSGLDAAICTQTCGGDPAALTECIETTCGASCSEGGGATSGGVVPGGAAYDPCMDNSECQMGLQCYGVLHHCTVPCMGDDALCPVPATGNTPPTCSVFNDVCVLDCGTGTECPDSMSCQQIASGIFRCTY